MDENISHSFKSISHPIRVQILLMLSARLNTGYQFSELSRELEIASSGKLSFHLDKMKDLVFVNGEGRYSLTGQGNKAVQAVKILGISAENQEVNENVTKSIVKDDGIEHENKMAVQLNMSNKNYFARSLKKYRYNFDTYVIISAFSLFILFLAFADYIIVISFGVFFSTLIWLHQEVKPTSKIVYRLPAVLYILGTFASEGGQESSIAILVLALLLYLLLLFIYKPKQNN